MSRLNFAVGGTVGERVTLAAALLLLCLETLVDDCQPEPQPEPITMDECLHLCASEGKTVHRWESWACECHEEGA